MSRWLCLCVTVSFAGCSPQLPDDLPSLMEAMGSTNQRVHYAASEKVMRTYGEEGLINALRHEDAGTRARAAMWLHHFSTSEARSALVSASRDQDDHVRMWVAYSLGEVGTPEEVPILEELTHDSAEIVRRRAREAIEALQVLERSPADHR